MPMEVLLAYCEEKRNNIQFKEVFFMSNVALYIIGTFLVAGGLAYGTSLFLGPAWAGVVGLIVLGLGVMSAVNSGRRREASPVDEM